jgi:hypothetical protein
MHCGAALCGELDFVLLCCREGMFLYNQGEIVGQSPGAWPGIVRGQGPLF